MSKKKITKNLAVLGGAVCLSLSILASPATSVPVKAAEATTVQPFSDKIEWRFKIEDGKIYKRLFNYSTISWVGDWIYVRDL